MNKAPKYDQINNQVVSAYMNRSKDMPTVLIKRSSGDITVGKLDTSTQDVIFTENGEEMYHPAVPMDRLTDERQAQLAEILAGKALRGTVEESADPLDELSAMARSEVLSYRTALRDKRNAENAKDFALAGLDRDRIYLLTQSLSNEAKVFLKLI